MADAIKDGHSFPMRCPSCQQLEGMPFMAQTHLEGGRINVAMQCRSCSHEWRLDMPVTTERKRDSGVHRNVKK